MTREQKMIKRKEAGKTYTYKPNPFREGTYEFREEKWKRKQKNFSHKTPTQKWTSIMAKLENQLLKEKMKKTAKVAHK